MSVIKVTDLVKRYGDLVALNHLNLSVEEGEIYGLLGPNGSGKSTLISCILQLLSFDKGQIEVFNRKMTPNSYDIKKDIGVVFQEVGVFDELTVRENIDYFCSLYISDKDLRKKNVDEAIEFVELHEFVKFYPKKLSGGLLRRLNIACGIAHKPKLIILDEPTVAVDPQSRNKILDGIVELNKRGATVLYTSHYMEEVEQICTRMSIIDKGQVVVTGTGDSLKAMIDVGERIKLTVSKPSLAQKLITSLEYVKSCEFVLDYLLVKADKNSHALLKILEVLKQNDIEVESAYSERPTLNDVFLEITGRELRDNV